MLSVQPRGDNGRNEELAPCELNLWRVSESRRTCEPLVLGPALAIDKSPGLLCLNLKFSSIGVVESDQKSWVKTGRTGEGLSEDGFSTGAIVTSEISTLKHELRVWRASISGRSYLRVYLVTHIRDYPMERGSLVAEAVLAGGKLAEVLSSLRDGFVVKFEHNPPGRLGINGNIELHGIH